MPTIAYLTNQFPSPVEWYVVEEIRELCRRGAHVLPCSARRPDIALLPPELRQLSRETLYLEPLRSSAVMEALGLCASRHLPIRNLLSGALRGSIQRPARFVRTLLHTALGAYYAVLLRDRGIEHIHVHHGYFSSWIALTAARLLGIRFSMTLHGSDLLLSGANMEAKLQECAFCVTISEFNRQHILSHYPAINPNKVFVQHLGVQVPPVALLKKARDQTGHTPLLLAVGRLHSVKNYSFLLEACRLLRESGMRFRCVIVGDGPERQKLERSITRLHLREIVTLAGHVPRAQLRRYYGIADLMVLTSRSEGIPLVLMEAMACGVLVLAPAITGIPELVIDGQTGFLYTPGALDEFVSKVKHICHSTPALQVIRQSAREHVENSFNLRSNVERFVQLLLEQITISSRCQSDANLILQQI